MSGISIWIPNLLLPPPKTLAKGTAKLRVVMNDVVDHVVLFSPQSPGSGNSPGSLSTSVRRLGRITLFWSKNQCLAHDR